MVSPSPTLKSMAAHRRLGVAPTIVSGGVLCLVLLVLSFDSDAIFHIQLAVAFAISTTVFAPIDRAQVLLQVCVQVCVCVCDDCIHCLCISPETRGRNTFIGPLCCLRQLNPPECCFRFVT